VAAGGEGLAFRTSDIDIMHVHRNAAVLNALTVIDNGCHKTMMLMERRGCHPGFVLLQLLTPLNEIVLTHEAIVQYHVTFVLSSLLYRDLTTGPQLGLLGFKGHGPCRSGKIRDREIDIAHCFDCKSWPSEAYEYVYRNRLYGWPKKDLLDKIIQNGCHVVPIGDKYSNISHIQWRLSFSVAEKALVHGFSHMQLKVYGLLKIFLKQAINKEEPAKDILCSYFDIR